MSELKSTNLTATLNAAVLNASLNSTIRLNDYIITLEEIEGGHRLTARKGDQVQSMDIMDGTPGKPGISPLITVTDITGGHRVTITDADGVKEFDVMDGQDGQGGGASVQPDWNQNDESQPDYVRNRTHYEIPPKFDIRWDGDMTGKFAFPLDDLGAPGSYLVKVSDLVLSLDDIVDATMIYYDGLEETINRDYIDTETFPGMYNAGYIVSVYNQEIINSALGLPDGTVTNGTYFITAPENGFYIAGFIDVTTIVKLDEKYLPDTYASKGYVDNLITGAIGGSY